MKITMKIRKAFLLAAVVAMLGVGSTVQASFVFGYGGATVNVNQSGDYILGNNFNVNSAIEVTQLGVFSQDAPIAGSISIGIYKYAGSSANWTLVSGTLQTIGSGALLDVPDQTAYINIASVLLGPGLYSVVTRTSSDYNSGFVYPNPSAVTFNNLGGNLSAGAYDIWNYGSSLGSSLSGMQTAGPGDPNYPWATPVFGAGTFSATAVPESTTIIAGALLLLPFGASTLRILRRKQTV